MKACWPYEARNAMSLAGNLMHQEWIFRTWWWFLLLLGQRNIWLRISKNPVFFARWIGKMMGQTLATALNSYESLASLDGGKNLLEMLQGDQSWWNARLPLCWRLNRNASVIHRDLINRSFWVISSFSISSSLMTFALCPRWTNRSKIVEDRLILITAYQESIYSVEYESLDNVISYSLIQVTTWLHKPANYYPNTGT